MIIIYCSKPQENDAVTPTPQAHRSHTCMRVLALGHDNECIILVRWNFIDIAVSNSELPPLETWKPDLIFM